MNSRVIFLLLQIAIAAGGLICTSLAGSLIRGPETQREPIDGAFTLGYQGSENAHTGYADVLHPLYAPSPNVALFYDGQFAFDDSDQDKHSHGLVLRYRVPDHDIIFGANVYYDSMESGLGNRFDQLGFGVEVLTKWIDFRANYYLPDQKRERIDTRTVMVAEIERELALTGIRRFLGAGEVVVPQFLFAESISGKFQRFEFTRFESPLEGLDAELGFLIPGLDRYAELRVFGGYYHFLNPYGRDYDGFKARFEARVRRGITAEVEYWDDDSLNGGQWSGGVRVSLPFNLGNLFAGRNPFEGASEAFGPPSGDFGDRLSDLVIRSRRVKTTTSDYIRTGVENPTSVTITRRVDGSISFIPAFEGSGSGSGGDVGGAVFTSGASLSLEFAAGGTLVVPSLMSFQGFTPEQLATLGFDLSFLNGQF